jgi:hypothetical protein
MLNQQTTLSTLLYGMSLHVTFERAKKLTSLFFHLLINYTRYKEVLDEA